MKVMLFMFNTEPLSKMLIDSIHKEGHEIVYWVSENAQKHLTPSTAIFHDYEDAWAGVPPEGGRQFVVPPSEELIGSMVATESMVLPMMNKRFDKASIDERKQIYYDMLGYWDSVIRDLKPGAVVVGTIPHNIFSYIVHDLAQHSGIPVLTSDPTWVGFRHFWFRDMWAGSDEFRANIKKYEHVKVGPDELDEELREYWEKHTGEHARTEPVYTTHERKKATGIGKYKNKIVTLTKLLTNGHFSSMVRIKLGQLGKGDLRKDYARFIQPFDRSIPFVYFPLHFQPECTTSPQGGVYHQQILAIQTLAAALPDGWEVYVKEHPGQWWTRHRTRYSSVRYPGYYERISQIPGARIVPIETNTFELTNRSEIVAVINSTSGWESLMRGKLPIVFGTPWWRDYPGVFRVNSVESCRAAFQSVRGGKGSARYPMLSFLKALEESTDRAYIQPTFEKELRYSPEENMSEIISQILKFLRESK